MPRVRARQPRARWRVGLGNRAGASPDDPPAPQDGLKAEASPGSVASGAMDFALSEELLALQDSVRRLAQDKVKPRAREIDESNEYPQDLFELFRDAGVLGLVIPTEYGGSGAGILGLTIAIEEIAKYSNAAALMLLLTRLPTGPVLIAGSDEQKRRYVTPVPDGYPRAAFGLPQPQAGR